MSVQPGQMLSHYRLVEKIGEGGMGVVWKALDTTLDRGVAIKTLPEELASDPERLARFEREAKVVAALNHPNIVTVHSVEEAEGTRFITMELVRGKPLTELIPRNGLPLGKFFELSTALADAISAAHQRGITHRDLKPDNVMIGDDGRLKVLDFGLAKLREEAQAVEGSTQLPTATVTQEGKILGTVSYMSPEQAEGKPIDHRSDIFSLGVMLYQMATGQRPFEGDTGVSIISSIVKDTPVSITELNRTLPRHLGRIVKRCLSKDPARRYHAAVDLRNDLEELKEEIDSGEALPAGAAAAARRRWPIVWFGVVAALAIVAMVVVWQLGGGAGSSELEMTRVPVDVTGGVTLSPDGKYLALSQFDEKGCHLEVAQVSTGSRVTILDSPNAELYAQRFSPDGEFIYYLHQFTGAGLRTLHRIPVLGGDPVPLISDVDTPVSFSPDGKRFAFVRWRAEGGAHLVVADADGSNERLVADRKPGEYLYSPAWSPDGRTIVVKATADGRKDELLLAFPAEGGEDRTVSSGWSSITGLAWSPDGSSLILTGALEDVDAANQIWEISFPGDEKRNITRDLNNYYGLALSADGEALSSVQRESRSWISVVEPGSGRDMRRVTPGGNRRDGNGLLWTPDGRILHCARVDGESNLWITDPETEQHRQISRLGTCHGPRLASDGRTVVFIAREATTWKLWKTDLQGRTPTPLAPDNALDLDLTPDDTWVVYLCGPGDNQGAAVCKIPLAGGEPRRLSDRMQSMEWIGLSPAGDRAAVAFFEMPVTSIAIISLDGGKPTTLEIEAREIDKSEFAGEAVWSPDGSSLFYVMIEDGVRNLWRRALDGSPPERLTDLHRSADGEEAGIGMLGLTADGTAMTYQRWEGTAVALLHRNIQSGDEEVVFQFPREDTEDRTGVTCFSHDGRMLALQRTRVTSAVVLLRNFR